MPLTTRLGAGRVTACALVLFAAVACQAEVPLAVHLDGGVGTSNVRHLESATTGSATMSAGLSAPTAIGLRATLGVIATAGDDVGGHIPEGPYSGKRSLTTIALGLERSDRRDARGLFASAGLGLGHMTSSGAKRGPDGFLSGNWGYPNRNLLGLGFAGSAGYRTHGGPGPLGIQFAFRYHGMASGGQMAVSAYAMGLGLVY